MKSEKRRLGDWKAGNYMMFLSYFLFIIGLTYFPVPLWTKTIVIFLMPVLFYIHHKQDLKIILEFKERGKNETL